MMPKKAHFNVLVHNGNNFSIKSDAKGNVIVKTKKASIKIDGSGNITLSGQKIVMKAKSSFTIKSMQIKLNAAIDLAIESGASMNLKSAAQLALNSTIILLNKGGKPAARIGDLIVGNNQGGKIIQGSPTVLIGQ